VTPPPIEIFLIQLFFSGLIAATVSFLLNRHDERRRTARDYVTKLFDAAREDVNVAMDAGVAYYTGNYVPLNAGQPPPDNVLLLEARVLSGEKNVRAAIAVLKRISGPNDGALASLEPLEIDFLGALTEHYGETNPAGAARARSVVLFGAPLRQELAQLRQNQLRPRVLGATFGRGTLLLIAMLLLMALCLAIGFYAGALTARG
jgi:hypothetical protein